MLQPVKRQDNLIFTILHYFRIPEIQPIPKPVQPKLLSSGVRPDFQAEV